MPEESDLNELVQRIEQIDISRSAIQNREWQLPIDEDPGWDLMWIDAIPKRKLHLSADNGVLQ